MKTEDREDAADALAEFIAREMERQFEEDDRRAIFRGELLIGSAPSGRKPCAEGESRAGRLLPFARPAICCLLAFLFACSGEISVEIDATITQKPEPSALAGRCRGGPRIVCWDSSTASGGVQIVTFFVRDAAGKTITVVTIPNGCPAGAQPCEIEVGLSPGTYSVLHSVVPEGGGKAALKVYNGLVVTGSGALPCGG